VLREYIDARIEFGKHLNQSALEKSMAHAQHLQNEMWHQSEILAQHNLNLLTPPFIQAVGTLADLSEQRVAAEEKRIPGEIWLVLVLMSVLTSFVVGYSMPRRLLLAVFVLPLTVAIVLSLVSELDNARTGFIHIGQQSMERLRVNLEEQEAPHR
jgi:hypothetical protein